MRVCVCVRVYFELELTTTWWAGAENSTIFRLVLSVLFETRVEVLSCTIPPTCTKGVNHREEQREQPRLAQPVPSIHRGAAEVVDPSNSPRGAREGHLLKACLESAATRTSRAR